MKKRILCFVLAAFMGISQAVTVSATLEQQLREEQAWTNQLLQNTYSRMNELWYQKEQLENEIAVLDADLVNVMVSIDVLKTDIAGKEADIQQTQTDLAKAEKARDKQYESMKQRIQYLYEKGGNDAWFQMMMNAENLSELLTKAEYTQQMYDYDRESLEKYVNTIEQVQLLGQKYSQEKAELEEMKAAYEEQSAVLQYQIEQKRIASANCDDELAYAEYMATEYTNLIYAYQEQIERLEAERLAAEAEARRQAEAAAAAAAAAEAQAQAEAEAAAQAEAEAAVSGETVYEDYENYDAAETVDDYEEYSEEVTYDEYGNVVDSSNTVDYNSSYSSSSGSSYSSGSGSSVVDYATQFVGNPYVYGGTSLTNGADCSGFVQSVYSNFGVSLPRTSYEQMNAGYEVSYSDAQPGDLICYGGHVAIYMGDGQIVHASNSAAYPAGGIKVSDNAAYRTILSVRRVID